MRFAQFASTSVVLGALASCASGATPARRGPLHFDQVRHEALPSSSGPKYSQSLVSSLGTEYKVTDRIYSPDLLGGSAQIRYVENSGVCETTPGVYQASGYVDLGLNMSMWFWFFEARKSPKTAPLSVWLNGGPGSSSMIGLFQEHGPCRVSNDSKTLNYNHYSWNNASHMLYIDQPVGVGYSHGLETVSGSGAAAAAVYSFLQIFFASARFSQYKTNKFALWTESYGGHYGPVFADYFEQQNAKNNGMTKVNLQVLGIGNGITDALLQYPKYCEYALKNPYGPTVSAADAAQGNTSYYMPGGCRDQTLACYTTGVPATCSAAQVYCNDYVLSQCVGDKDVYDVRTTSTAYPPDITSILTDPAFMKKIGAEKTWEESNTDIYALFLAGGDWFMNKRPNLEAVIKSGVRTFLFNGDADYICNYMGWEAMINGLQTQYTAQYAKLKFTPWTVGGKSAGKYKSVGSFTYLRFYQAGHEVPAYKNSVTGLKTGEASLAFFASVMSGAAFKST